MTTKKPKRCGAEELMCGVRNIAFAVMRVAPSILQFAEQGQRRELFWQNTEKKTLGQNRYLNGCIGGL